MSHHEPGVSRTATGKATAVLGGRRLPRHGAFYFAAGVGAAAGAVSALLVSGYAVHVAMIGLFVTYLALTASELPRLTPAELSAHADEADAPGLLIFAAMLLVVVVAAVSLFIVVNAGHSQPLLPLGFGIAAVLLGWFAVHTMMGLHYAYEYYGAGDDQAKAPADKAVAGGLDFPGKRPPDGAAFVYFSFVIGMTAQVADVDVTSGRMRWLVLAHGIFSYFFNTVILAAAVNVVVALGGAGS